MADARRGRPRSEPRDAQHERVVRAARAAFTERGYDAVTLSSIATDANVPRPVVYEVVGTKEHLLGAVAEQVADELIAAVDDHFSRPVDLEQPLADLVRGDVRWFVDLISSDPSFVAVIRLAGRLDSADDNPATRARRRIEDRIDQLHVARAQGYGVDLQESARVLAVIMLALLESVTLRMGDAGWPAAAVADLVAEFAAGGYLRTELIGATERFEAEVHPPGTAN
jgi:AcrR family transcriptional regulator